MDIRSLQNFAHVTTAMLSWHVQNFVVITSLQFDEGNESVIGKKNPGWDGFEFAIWNGC